MRTGEGGECDLESKLKEEGVFKDLEVIFAAKPVKEMAKKVEQVIVESKVKSLIGDKKAQNISKFFAKGYLRKLN